MAAVYECRHCHVITSEPAELCLPVGVDIRCDYGRDLNEHHQRMCRPVRVMTTTECDMCGRPTLREQLVCLPTEFTP
jgi:hypothetical protein